MAKLFTYFKMQLEENKDSQFGVNCVDNVCLRGSIVVAIVANANTLVLPLCSPRLTHEEFPRKDQLDTKYAQRFHELIHNLNSFYFTFIKKKYTDLPESWN